MQYAWQTNGGPPDEEDPNYDWNEYFKKLAEAKKNASNKKKEEESKQKKLQEDADRDANKWYNDLKNDFKKHIFEGEVEPKTGRPTGLHAYTDGALPPGVEVLASEPSPEGVHLIIWAPKGSSICKWSTMFPKSMKKGAVAWYLSDNKSGKKPPGTDKDIAVSGAGNTKYPNLGTLEEIKVRLESLGYDKNAKTVTKDKKTYKMDNPP